MTDYTNELVVGVIGFTATATAWFLGGKQIAKNSKDDTLTRGADQIVETSSKLLTTLEKMLDEEREHRTSCEVKVEELTKRLDQIERKQ